MSNTQASQRPRRAPSGCRGNPVWMNLTPTERAELEAIADTEMRTLSAQARMFYLRGLEAIKAEKTAPISH
ncbi:hypothetical protein [Larsenimonas rhizosphaerae]|uniref:hypothetical protein n=1 Tax=Larsenimonas rhizosphaerae TaxID=2944682 RepID=UPI002034A6B2|nr:hypothetical protein [Larsenimonas rhizosphaerae]MCM2131442.1 hypothetical protein [Larsenimonas rhizosphaerae]